MCRSDGGKGHGGSFVDTHTAFCIAQKQKLCYNRSEPFARAQSCMKICAREEEFDYLL